MARPFKCRRIGFRPDLVFFKPAGMPLSELEEVILTVDELEAIRLADLLQLYHQEASGRMNISRQTFGNILSSARKKIANGIINGKAIRIEGVVFSTENKGKFICEDCDFRWEIVYGTRRPLRCPKCEKNNFFRSPDSQDESQYFPDKERRMKYKQKGEKK